MAKIGRNAKLEIWRQASLLSPGDRLSFIDSICKTYRCSRRHARRIIEDFLPTGRVVRRDKGQQRIALTEEQRDYLIGLSIRYDFAAWHAIEYAERAGAISKGSISPATYNHLLREHESMRARAKKDVKPVRRFEKPFPNHTHHFDTTKIEELFLDRETRMVTWEPKRKKRNSRGEKAPSVWLYSLVDDYSRVKYARFFEQENQWNHFDFFYRAWSRKEDAVKFPFYGLPRCLYMDLGPVNHATALKEAFKRLGTHVTRTTPSTAEPFGSRKHGKVERPFQDYNEFLKEIPILAPIHFDELNERLYHHVIFLNNRLHSEIETTPFARWMEIGAARETPPEKLYAMLYRNRETRVVSSELMLSVDGHIYKLPERRPYVDWVKQKVEVIFVPGQYDTINVINGYEEIELRELAGIHRPSFNRRHIDETSIDIKRAEVGKINYSAVRPPPIGQEGRINYLPRKGEPFDEKRIAEKYIEETGDGQRATVRRPSFAPERYLTYITAARELQTQGVLSRPLSMADQAWLRNIFADREQISETELQSAVRNSQSAIDKADEG